MTRAPHRAVSILWSIAPAWTHHDFLHLSLIDELLDLLSFIFGENLTQESIEGHASGIFVVSVKYAIELMLGELLCPVF